MDLRNCRRCHKVFVYRGNYVCPDCLHEIDKLFVDVRNYLYDNPAATIESICESTGAEEEDVLGWLREGRLILSADSPPLLECEGCGEPIHTGRYCANCKDDVKNQLQNTAREMRPFGQAQQTRQDNQSGRNKSRMHIYDER